MRKPTGSVKKIAKRKYQVRMTYTDGETGKRIDIKRLFDSDTDARVHLNQLLLKYRKDGVIEKVINQLTFAELAARYAALKLIPAVYEGGHKLYGQAELSAPRTFLKVLTDHFGRKLVKSITYNDLEQFKLKRLETPTRNETRRSVRTVNAELQMMSMLLNFAVRNNWIERNPFKQGDSLITKAAENRRERTMTSDEESRLLNVCINERSHLKAIIITAVDTGLRRGELFKLEWSELDFEQRMIRLPAQKAKTRKARSVAMTERVFKELSALREATPDHQSSVFGISDNVKNSWNTACRLAEIKGLNFHDLRHTFVTRAIAAGIPVAEVMKASGHLTLTMLSRYLNPDTDSVKRVATALDEWQIQQKDENFLASPMVN